MIAILLGASAWPLADQFEAAPQFLSSAKDFKEYIASDMGLGLQPANILDLFDAEDEAPALQRRIAEFLDQAQARIGGEGASLTDLLIFYVGHGGFDVGSGSNFFLAIRKTSSIDYLTTSLTISALRTVLRARAGNARHYLIFDCCFAAAAAGPYILQSAANQAMVAQRL